MMPPIIILNYDPLLPWYLAPLLWMLGVGCLWATRFGSTWGARLGRRYFIFSSIVRPLGILLIGWGWMELCAPVTLPTWTESYLEWQLFLWLVPIIIAATRRRFFPLAIGIFLAISIVGFGPGMTLAKLIIFWLAFVFSLWSIWKLGLRQSFLYRRPGDKLVTDGPYAVCRHPQLLAAALMAFSSALVLSDEWAKPNLWAVFNSFPFGVALWLMILAEERDLEREAGEEWRKYAAEIPRFWPVVDRRTWHSLCRACGSTHSGRLETCPNCGEKKVKAFSRPLPAMGCLLPLLLPALLLMVGTIFINPRLISFRSFYAKLFDGKHGLDDLQQKQKDFRAAHGAYAVKFSDLHFQPRKNELAYCMGDEFIPPAIFNRLTPEELNRDDQRVRSACRQFSGASASGFTALAIGNQDRDPALEVWVVNDSDDRPRLINGDEEENVFKPLTDKDLMKE